MNELYHFGVLGMRWGVRRYQNKDGSLTSLGRKRLEESAKQYEGSKHGEDISFSKSSRFYRIGAENESAKSGPKHTYVVASDKDYYKYASIAGEGIRGRTKYTLDSNKELKIAGYKAQANALMELYGNNKLSDIQQGFVADSRYHDANSNVKSNAKIIANAFKDDEGFNEALRFMGQELMADSKTSETFKNYLKSKGYDGVVDMNDDDFADLPLYLFDRSNLVEKGRQEVSRFDKDYMTTNYGDDW